MPLIYCALAFSHIEMFDVMLYSMLTFVKCSIEVLLPFRYRYTWEEWCGLLVNMRRKCSWVSSCLVSCHSSALFHLIAQWRRASRSFQSTCHRHRGHLKTSKSCQDKRRVISLAGCNIYLPWVIIRFFFIMFWRSD